MNSEIEIGDIYLITMKNGEQYEGEVCSVSEDYLSIEIWDGVKDYYKEIDIEKNEIKEMIGYNDSQTQEE